MPPLLVVFIASRTGIKLDELTDLVTDMVARSPTMGLADKYLLLRDLDAIKLKRQTGLSFFTLDRSFMASYVGSVLTFAALIVGFTKQQ